ncbi:MAG TPA: hypothetical protein VGM23_11575, partial [Armatimonadota bacterium]
RGGKGEYSFCMQKALVFGQLWSMGERGGGSVFEGEGGYSFFEDGDEDDDEDDASILFEDVGDYSFFVTNSAHPGTIGSAVKGSGRLPFRGCQFRLSSWRFPRGKNDAG